MNKWIMALIAGSFALSVQAQNGGDNFPYTFKVVKDNTATETKDQCNTGTCWSFATSSFIESELIRMGKGEHDISEMYAVRMTYPMKAENYVRYQGKAQFGPGSLSHDVINVIREYGIVPESVYSGLDANQKRHDHGELDAVLEGMVKAVVDKNHGRISGDWDDAVDAVLDVYLGEAPEAFEYQGKRYTPQSFRDAMELNPDDYVSITSFTHHEFYDDFILEVPDNFSQGEFYNVPLDELVRITKDALAAGFTVAWDADV
ncbi:MAG: aminopeptidase, partial [Flavobacteriales bacterium]|nr:aminopeptidase [Flavobacteriales bacterium]